MSGPAQCLLVYAGLTLGAASLLSTAAGDPAPVPQLRPAASARLPLTPVPDDSARAAATEGERDSTPATSGGQATAQLRGASRQGPQARPELADEVARFPEPVEAVLPPAQLDDVNELVAGDGAMARLVPPDAAAPADGPSRPPAARPEPPSPEALDPVQGTGESDPASTQTEVPAEGVEISPDDLACLARLPELGVQFRPLDPIDAGGSCPVSAPLEVASAGSGVALNAGVVMNCRTAEMLGMWVRDVLVPAARTHLDAAPESLVSSGYECRTRNRQPGAKISEHAIGNAVDVAAINFTDRPPLVIEPRPADGPEGQFQAEIREAACDYFTTVLGPGSDAAHADHLHFDMAERRGGYRLCDLGETETAGGPP